MINIDALVIYKGKPALVKETIDGKYSIAIKDGEKVKVRDKDIELLHPGPIKNFNELDCKVPGDTELKEIWELLLEESAPLTIKDLSGFIFNDYTPACAYAVFCLLRDNLYFSGNIDIITPRSREEVSAQEIMRSEKQRETGERALFLEQIKACLKKSTNGISGGCNTRLNGDLLNKWAPFVQDIEALAYGKSAKSRTMRELDLSETPEDAHFVLLRTGFWTGMVNPHPSRFGLALNSAGINPDPPPLNEDRRDLCHLPAFAIDSPWSNDPDDAVSIERSDTCTILYVHVADPASSIRFDSPAEKEARDRGATLYLPEGIFRMLAENTINLFGLGLAEKSIALTFKITVDESGAVKETEIFPSVVRVRRITYEEADMEMEADTKDAADLRALFNLARKINERRSAHGAVNIELPDVRIYLKNEEIFIDPIPDYKSAFLVKECMIAAGEGAGSWAASKALAFPYISQEVELQSEHMRVIRLGGIAGAIQLRKCMRPRVLSAKPGRHQGLGLDTYTQVTSPLRRYTDLLAHIQIRAFLSNEKLLSADEISARLGFCEAGAAAAVHAERASANHWKMVYLLDKKDMFFDAVAVEDKGNRMSVLIPTLALETQVVMQNSVLPNERTKINIKSINIPKGEAIFTHNV